MVFRGRGGRPPRGRGFRGRGRGRGFPGRGRGFDGRDCGPLKKQKKRSRSRSRSPKSKRNRGDERSSSRDKHRRENSRDRDDRSRNQDRRYDDRRGRKGHSIDTGRSKRDRSRSASPHRNSSKRSGSDRDSYDRSRRSRSHSPPSNRSRERSPSSYRGTSPRSYDEGPSNYDDHHPDMSEVSRSKWDSPEPDESPGRRGRESRSPHRGTPEDVQSHGGNKYRSNTANVPSHKQLQTESLRITVGNERFQRNKQEQDDSHKSAMERLGPPVSQELQESEDLDDLYQDLPPPAPLPSLPKGLSDFPTGNTTPLRDEAAQKHREPLKPKSKPSDARQHGSSVEKERSRDRGKDKDTRSKRSKEREYDDNKARIRPKDHEKHHDESGRYSKERDYKGHSKERSYEKDRGDSSDFQPPSDRHGGGPSADPVLTQATLLVQSIRQSTSNRGDQYPGAAGSEPVGSSGGQPPHTGAPFAQQMPGGGADGLYHQGSQSSYPSAPGPPFPGHPPHGPPHPYQQQGGQPPMQQQQPHYPQANQQFQPPQQYPQPGMNPQHGYPPPPPQQDAYKNQQSSTSTEYNPFLSHPGSHSIPGMDGPKDVNFGSVDEEDLFLYGDSAANSQQGSTEKKQQHAQSSDFWTKRAGQMEEYVPEEKPAPTPEVEEKPAEKTPGDVEDDQIKKILSVIGFDFDLAKKIADQKKQQEEEEKLRRQARASKKGSVKPTQSTDPHESPQPIASLAGQRENQSGSSSFNPSGSFLDSGLQAPESSQSIDSFVQDAKQNVTQTQQAYEQHDRLPASQQVAPQQSGASHPVLHPPPQLGPPPSNHQQGGFSHIPPPIMYDQYGRPLPPPANYPPVSQPYQQFQAPPPGQPHYQHPGPPPPQHQGYGPPPTTQPQQHSYYSDQHESQYPPPHAPPPHDQSFPPTTEAYPQSHGYHQHSPGRYSRSRSRSESRGRSRSQSSSSGRSGSSRSSQSESPERTPPPKRSRDRSRSHSQSVRDHSEERGRKEKIRGKSLHRNDEEYGPELPSEKGEGSRSPRRIVLLPKSEREDSGRKRKFKEEREVGDSLDKLKHLEKAELKKLRQLYKDEREALEKKKKKEEDKERALEEKKLQQAIKRKEAERKKEREMDEKKRQAIEKRKKQEEEKRFKEDEMERMEEERKIKEIEKHRKVKEAAERARQIKLAQDKHIYSKRLEALESALSRLRKQEGELLRKKQRERAGHKDPILVENNKLQDEIASQLKALRVAFTEGRVQHVKFEETIFKEEIKLREKAFEKQLKDADDRKAKERDDRKSSKSSKAKTDEEKAERQPFQFTYVDPGNHWCKLCKLSLQSLNNLFIHLHSKKHMQKCDPYCRPWVPDDISTKKPKGSTVTASLGGAEFMMPVNAFYCKLCREFSGDGFCASEHLKSVKHNIKYQKFIEENPNYVKKLEVERAADEKPSDVKEEKDTSSASAASKEKDEKDEKAKIKVDIGHRGGFGKFRFLKKEGDHSKEKKEESKDVKKEEKASGNESTIELRKSESSKQQSQSEKEKEKDGLVGKDKKEIKINIKLSGRQFVPMSVQKAGTPSSHQPAKPITVKAKPPPPPPVSTMKSAASIKAKMASKVDFKPKDSLDSFLSIGGGGKGKALPVFKDVEKKKKEAVPSQDEIAAAFSGSKSEGEPKKETKEAASESDEKSGEDALKPSFSDTLRKMLFTSSQKGDEKPDEEDDKDSEEKAGSSFSSIFNTIMAGMQPGIPGIDDDDDDGDELKPPGT